MKKYLLVLSLFALCMGRLHAQELQYGAKLGMNLANLDVGTTVESEMKIGFHTGFYVLIPLADRVSLEPGVYYSTKGAKTEEKGVMEFFGEVVAYDVEGKTTLKYLDIPVLVRFNVISGLNVFIGPQFSYLLGNKAEVKGSISYNGIEEAISESDNSTEGMNKIDLGLVMGLGYQFDNGLNLNVGYDLGMSNVVKESDTEINNRVIQISVGYNF